MNKILACIMIVIGMGPSSLKAQDKKKAVPATVCATPVPSRTAAINASKKTAGTPSSKTPACCKGAPSRFAAVRTTVKK